MIFNDLKPRVLILIDRQLYYKFLAPIINEVLARGLSVLCLHDYHNDEVRFSGLKATQFSILSVCPQFPAEVELRAWRKYDDIKQTLITECVQFVYALHGPDHYGLKEADEELEKIIWVQLQHGADSFLDGKSIGRADIFARYTPEWGDLFNIASNRNVLDVGCLALNSIKYNENNIRVKYSLPIKKKIVVYFACDHPLLMGGQPSVIDKLWYRYVFCDDYWQGMWQFVPKLLSKIACNEYALVRALRLYATQRDALLIIKSRAKRVLSPSISKFGDYIMYDDSLYPSTNYELMNTSELVVCIASTCHAEAAFFGVPVASLYPKPMRKYLLESINMNFPEKIGRYMLSVCDFLKMLKNGDFVLPKIQKNELFKIFGNDLNGAKKLVEFAETQISKKRM